MVDLPDIDVLRRMLDRAGIVYREDVARAGQGMGRRNCSDEQRILVIAEGAGPRNSGYVGFLSWAHFDAAGNLVEWSSWE